MEMIIMTTDMKMGITMDWRIIDLPEELGVLDHI